jgi:hypothetical protein
MRINSRPGLTAVDDDEATNAAVFVFLSLFLAGLMILLLLLRRRCCWTSGGHLLRCIIDDDAV